MQTSDFVSTIIVDQTPEQVFLAIKNITKWWSEEIEGNTDNVTDEFIYHYKDIHYSKMKLIEIVPNQKLVWLVLDNYFKFTKDKSEWIGTKLVFNISQKDDKTEVNFTHEGLVSQYECYEICRESWTNYIQNSLYDLITTGNGKPNPKLNDGYNAEIVKKWKLQ